MVFPNSRLKKDLQALVRHAGPEIEALRDDIGGWFDTRMEGLSRAYRRRTRWWLLVLGLIVTVDLNVDAIHITTQLFHDGAMRTLVASEADSLAQEREFADGRTDDACQQKIEAAGDALELPVWWSDGVSVDFLAFVGWVISAVAIALGAPFWFDVLRRVAGFKKAATNST